MEDTAGDTADDTAEDTAEDTADDTAEDTAEDTADDTAEDTADDTAEDTADDTAEDTAGDTADDTADDTAEDTAEDTADDTAEDTAEDTSAPIAWEEGRNTFEHDGRSRTVLLELPEVVPPGAPLVLAFHGYTDSASSLRSYSGLGDLARSEGFVVAYPSGTRDAFGNRFFNVGYDFQDEDVDDAGFARALAGQLVRDLGLDFSRVFVTGMSNGGDFAYLLACEPDPFVRAVAPVAGMMLDTIGADCADDGRVSIAEFHGTADDVTYYGGDPTNADGWGAYAGMGELMSFFVSRYALEAFETRTIPSTRNTVTLQRWSTASDDTEVRLYRIDGGGHVWPSVGGEGFSASEELWSFFSGFASERIE